MDINDLKLIIDAVKTVSGDAQSVAVWWIIADKIAPIIGWLLTACGIVYLVRKIIITSERTSIAESCETDMKIIGNLLKTHTGHWLTKEEREATINAVRNLAKSK